MGKNPLVGLEKKVGVKTPWVVLVVHSSESVPTREIKVRMESNYLQ